MDVYMTPNDEIAYESVVRGRDFAYAIAVAHGHAPYAWVEGHVRSELPAMTCRSCGATARDDSGRSTIIGPSLFGKRCPVKP
jgi:hypothetical protein